MSTIYEINMSNAQADVNTGRVKQNSKIVEVFSALSAGKRPEVDDKTLDKSVATIKELSSKAIDGDNAARSEINSIIRFSIEPKLLEVVRLFDFMEFGAGVAEGMEDQIGLISDTNFDAPTF